MTGVKFEAKKSRRTVAARRRVGSFHGCNVCKAATKPGCATKNTGLGYSIKGEKPSASKYSGSYRHGCMALGIGVPVEAAVEVTDVVLDTLK